MSAASPTDFEILEADRSDSLQWHAFVNRAVQGTFFHSNQWISLIADCLKQPAKRLFCLKKGQPLAAVVFFEKRRLFWQVVTPVPLFPFTAPVFNPPVDQKNQKVIAEQLEICAALASYMNRVYDYWILDTPWIQQDMRGYLWNRASVQPRYTYLVELSGEGQVISGCSQSTRKKIKQADASDYMIRESKDTAPLVELIHNSYKRHGIRPVIEGDTLKRFLSLVVELENIRLYYLSNTEGTLSGRLVLFDRETVFDLLAGSDDPHGHASTYLVYHIMKQAMSEYRYFNFMGADHAAIEQFKRGFGGSLRQGFRIFGKSGILFSSLIKANEFRLIRKRKL